MEYASRVTEIINAFSPEPLKGEQMQRFYYSDTMEYRMSDKYSSPMEDIFDICRQPGEQNAILLLSHRGGGKTTELNWMSEKLRVNGYQVKQSPAVWTWICLTLYIQICLSSWERRCLK